LLRVGVRVAIVDGYAVGESPGTATGYLVVDHLFSYTLVNIGVDICRSDVILIVIRAFLRLEHLRNLKELNVAKFLRLVLDDGLNCNVLANLVVNL
jgi:hypothetical protein